MSVSLHLQNLAKHFDQGGKRLEILKDLSLEVAKGEVVAIVGQSGSGKSTLLSLIAGFERPDHGKRLWQGESSEGWSQNRWAQFRKSSLGFVFQNYHLLPYLTAEENVALPLQLLKKSQARQTAATMLSRLGLESRANHLPNRLSGGERQRVAIARALVHQPELILADEPTGSLDAQTGENVLNVFFEVLKSLKQTAIFVTHSREVATLCDRRLELKMGRLWSI